MNALSFVHELLDSGRPRVPRDGKLEDCESAVRELDRLGRIDLAFSPPAMITPVAVWALQRVFYACHALVYREVGEKEVKAAMTVPCPQRASPGVCYSADLSLRLLPDLVGLARGINSGDPLVEGLMALAQQWPLSSVGIRDVGPIDAEPFIRDRCLRRLYADRIIERTDVSRLGHPVVDDAVRAAIGAHDELAPALAKALSKLQEQETP
jgi:hypothetical protein